MRTFEVKTETQTFRVNADDFNMHSVGLYFSEYYQHHEGYTALRNVAWFPLEGVLSVKEVNEVSN